MYASSGCVLSVANKVSSDRESHHFLCCVNGGFLDNGGVGSIHSGFDNKAAALRCVRREGLAVDA